MSDLVTRLGVAFSARRAGGDAHPSLQDPPDGLWDGGPPALDDWTLEVVAEMKAAGDGIIELTGRVDAPAHVRAVLRRQAGERFYGLGERSDVVARTDGVVENWVGEGPYQLPEYPLIGAITPRWALRQRRDAAYFPVPWVLSSAGYGVLVDSPELSRFRFSERAPAWSIEIEAPRLGLRIFEGPTAADSLRRFTEATGRQPYPAARWFLGPWVQTGHADLVPYDEEARIVSALREADAPVSAIETHMRRLPGGAHEGRRDDERRRTDLFHRHGLASLTYLNPFISRDYNARFADAQPLLQRRQDGSPYLFDAYIGGRQPPVTTEGQLDFSRPEAAELFEALAKEAVEDGHDGWMEDFGEYTPPDAMLADGTAGAAAHNPYPVAFHAAGARAAERAGAGRPIARFGRSGWTGAAPHLPLVWGGDPTTSWGFDGLASAVVEALSAGLSGLGLWGTDIGGFFSLGEESLNVELLVRWIQLGALSPLMRTKAEGIAIPPRPRPQVWDDEVLPHWRRWAKLHTQLSPYLLGAAAEYAETGLPLVRHHCLGDGGEALLDVEDQYLLGGWLLVAPVLEPGARERSIRVPPGRWLDAWRTLDYDPATGGLSLRGSYPLTGPGTMTVPAPLEEAPLLIRAGAVLPLLPAETWSLAESDDVTALHVIAFPDGDTETRMGRRGRLHSALSTGRWSLTIEGHEGEVELEAALPFPPSRVELELDETGDWAYDEASKVLRMRFQCNNHGASVVITW